MALQLSKSFNAWCSSVVHSRPFSAAGRVGWKVPPTSLTPTTDQQKRAVKRIQINLLSTNESIKLLFKQRFTVSPGSDNNHDMTGTWVWPTALEMATRLQEDLQQRDKPLNVLELGSGCGLVGMICAALNHNVVLTDHAQNVDCLRQNVELNREIVGNRAAVTVLEWGNENDMAAIRDAYGEFDVIVGSDLIYDAKIHEGLLKTMRYFAATPRNPSIYFGYPNRGPTESSFLHTAEQYFDIEVSPLANGGSNRMYAICRLRE